MFETIRELSSVEESELVERARQGDDQARTDLVVSLLPRVQAFAFHYKRTYCDGNNHLDVDDLCQEAALLMWEKLSISLDKNVPGAYLLVLAFNAIRRFCSTYETIITTPDDPQVRNHARVVASLDAPLTNDGESFTLLDVIASPGPENAPETMKDHTPLYQAIEQLPPGQKTMVIQHYGLYETEAKDFVEIYQGIGRMPKDVSIQHKQGLRKLQAWLAPVYPLFYDPGYRPRAQSNPATTVIPPDIRARLDRVRQEKADQWAQMDAFKLRKVAGVDHRFASAYLRQAEVQA
jgi:DNA-directed RNA polymerase specialized sigma24 family protein